VVQNNNARGWSGARNCGIKASNGEVIVFLDDDAVADQDWLEVLMSHYEDPMVIGVGGKIEPMYLKGRPAWFPEEFDWVGAYTYRGLPENVAAGRNLSFRHEVLERTGGFQIELGRMREYPAARVRNRVTPERARWRYLLRRCYSEGSRRHSLPDW
jgi:glycosyltransferase involved in cell wall biosynthesis